MNFKWSQLAGLPVIGLKLLIQRSAWQTAWLYLRLVKTRFIEDGCQHSAAALTYMSLFAVVPLLTVTYSMLSLVPVFQGLGDQLQDFILLNFLPDAGAEVQSYLTRFSQQARGLSFIGVGILVVTAALMLANIERVFNRIWATTGRRKGVTSFLLYWAVLSLGPILMGAGLVINTYVLSLEFLPENIEAALLNPFLEMMPLILASMAFTLIYRAVPNCHVMFRHALAGGVVAAVAFEVAKAGFGYFVSRSSYASIYGAFAAMPIFLLWIYLCWMIVLAGAEFVRAAENIGVSRRGGMLPLHAAIVTVLWVVWQRHQRGRQTREMDIKQAGVSPDRWQQARDSLLKANLIHITEQGQYALARPLDQVTLWDIRQLLPEAYRMRPVSSAVQASEPLWWPRYDELMTEVVDNGARVLALDLEALFRQAGDNNLN